jgi:predicted PurR-regulated permease PerM
LIVLGVACLALAKALLVPLALTMLATFVLSPVVTALQRRRVPRVPAVLTVVGSAILGLAICGWILTSQMVQFLDQLPAYQGNIGKRIADLRASTRHSVVAKVETFVQKVTAAATKPILQVGKKVQEEAESGEPSARPAPVEGKTAAAPPAPSNKPPQQIEIVHTDGGWGFTPWLSTASQFFEVLVSLLFVTVLLIYVLIKREDVRNRFLRLIGEGHMTQTTRAVDEAARSLSRFLLAQLLINVSFGACVGLGLLALGLPYPLLWGSCAAFLRYIPYVGSWIALCLPLMVSLAIHPGWVQPILIVVLCAGLELLAGLVAEPLVYGQSMGVSPAALLVAIIFWSWIWGAMGLVMAVPLTVCLVVLGKHVEQLQFLDVLLGESPALTVEIQFYQRLLARDQDEASEIVGERIQKGSLEEVCDQVVLPALIFVRRDLDEKQVTESEFSSIVQMIREIFEEHAGNLHVPDAGPEVVARRSPSSRLQIVACPARDIADLMALEILQRLLDSSVCELHIVSLERLVSEMIAIVEAEQPSVVCIGALPPGGLARTRLLCKRLRVRFPQLKILVGRWGVTKNVETERDQLQTVAAVEVGTTLAQTSAQIAQLAHYMTSPDRPLHVDSDHSGEPLTATK